MSETAAGRAGTRDAMVFLIFIMHYHKLMSNDIPNDDYFVLLLRKAWQIRALRTRALSRSLSSDRLRRCPRCKPDLLSAGWSVCLHVCHL